MFTGANMKKAFSRPFKLATAVITILFALSVTITAFAGSIGFINVTVIDGDSTYTVSAKGTTPESVLNSAGIILGANDELDASGFDAENGGTIIINRAKTLRVIDNDDIIYCVGYSTVGETLNDCGLDVADEDEISVSLNESVEDGMQVVINRAFSVTVEADGEETEIVTTSATVEEILDEAGVEVGEKDDVSHELSDEINGDSVIVVGRVEYKERTVSEDIPFETEEKMSSKVFEGSKEVTTEGKNGAKEVIYKDKYVDGKLISSEKLSETVIKKPQNKIISIGTRKRPTLVKFKDGLAPISDLTVPSYVELDENSIPKNFVDYYEGEATAYSGDPATASGRVPCQGHIAVDPKQFPYGTELYIVSLDGKYNYGYCIAADTGGFVYTTNVIADLYMDTEEMCYEWGRRNVAIYVISYAK